MFMKITVSPAVMTAVPVNRKRNPRAVQFKPSVVFLAWPAFAFSVEVAIFASSSLVAILLADADFFPMLQKRYRQQKVKRVRKNRKLQVPS